MRSSPASRQCATPRVLVPRNASEPQRLLNPDRLAGAGIERLDEADTVRAVETPPIISGVARKLFGTCSLGSFPLSSGSTAGRRQAIRRFFTLVRLI